MNSVTSFFKIPQQRNIDVITDLKFLDCYPNLFLVTSWNNSIFLYDCTSISNENEKSKLVADIEIDCTPLCVYSNENKAYIGKIDGSIDELDFSTLNVKQHTELKGSNNKEKNFTHGINNISKIKNTNNLIASSTFNGKLSIIDTRENQVVLVNNFKPNIQFNDSYNKKKKIFTMDSSDKYLLLGLNSNIIEIYDYKKFNEPYESRSLGFKYQIKDLKCFPNNQGFSLATIDGRVSIEYFDPSYEIQSTKRFTFKCHRHSNYNDPIDTVHSVNTIFNTKYDTLFSGGSDGQICLWDYIKKKRIRMYPKFFASNYKTTDIPSIPIVESVVKIDLNNTNNLLVVGTSDDSYLRKKSCKKGFKTIYSSNIYITTLNEENLKGKN